MPPPHAEFLPFERGRAAVGESDRLGALVGGEDQNGAATAGGGIGHP